MCDDLMKYSVAVSSEMSGLALYLRYPLVISAVVCTPSGRRTSGIFQRAS